MLVATFNKEKGLAGTSSVIEILREGSFPALAGTTAGVLLPDSDHYWWLLLDS